ncbi:unnamed protein product, partial [Pelagomonas calceolata]
LALSWAIRRRREAPRSRDAIDATFLAVMLVYIFLVLLVPLAERDAPPRQVVGRQLDLHAVADQNLDEVLADLPRDRAEQDLFRRADLDPKVRGRQRLGDDAIHFNFVVLDLALAHGLWRLEVLLLLFGVQLCPAGRAPRDCSGAPGWGRKCCREGCAGTDEQRRPSHRCQLRSIYMCRASGDSCRRSLVVLPRSVCHCCMQAGRNSKTSDAPGFPPTLADSGLSLLFKRK